MRALNGFWWLLGFSPPEIGRIPAVQPGSPPARQCRTGRKRLRRITRLFLAVLPRRVQGLLGYPVCTSIGCSVSPGKRPLLPLYYLRSPTEADASSSNSGLLLGGGSCCSLL